MELWVDKHKPRLSKEIASQDAAVGEVARWLETWKPGKALLLAGPPGTGKTLIAEVAARERGWMLVQLNAGDQRNSEAIERQLYEASKNHPLFHVGKLILVDEVDGISGTSDRGGVNAIAKIVKASKFPVIITANDPYIPKLQALRAYAKIIKLSRLDPRSIEKRLREICEKEKIKAEGDVLRHLARWSSGDLRSAINDLQMLCEGRKEISESDFEAIGFRERETNIYSVLPTVFRSRNLSAAKQAIQNCDKDPEDVFWWVENNIPQEFADSEALANALDMLSKADLFRQKVRVQQNWRFRLFMIEALAGISFAGEPAQHFVKYMPPDRFAMLARLKFSNAKMGALYDKVAKYTHSTRKIVKNEYLPYLRLLLASKKSGGHGLELSEEEKEAIVSG
jgi:replication factor C large subunit